MVCAGEIDFASRRACWAARNAFPRGPVLAGRCEPSVRHLTFTLDQPPAVRLFSARHEFPEQWYRFLHPEDGAQQEVLALPLDDDRFPYAPGSPERVITRIQLIVLPSDGSSFTPGVSIPLTLSPPQGSPIATQLSTALTEPDLAGRTEPMGDWTLSVALADIPRSLRAPGGGTQPLDPAAVRDIGILCTYAAT